MLKTRRQIVTLLGLVTLTGVGRCLLVKAEEPNEANKIPKLSLQIATVLDAPKTTLAFTVVNKDTEKIETTDLASNHNRVFIVKPDGDIFEYGAWKRFAPEVIIGPGESKTWKLDIPRIFEYQDLKAPGQYQVYWKLQGNESARVSLLKE